MYNFIKVIATQFMGNCVAVKSYHNLLGLARADGLFPKLRV